MLNLLARYRKAITAFLVPFLTLPLAGWASGDVPFDKALLYGTAVSAVTALLTALVSNAPAPGEDA